MNVLTTNGYKPIEDIVSSDNLIAYDAYTGQQIINHLNYKQKWQEYDFEGTASITYDEWDGNNNQIKSNVIIPDISWQFYRINNTWTLYALESIWVNTDKVIHVSELQIGDTIYDENDNDIIITDIQHVTSSEWWRLSISGDHSYIADDLTLHNPSRYWVGGGSSTNYNAAANTNWASTSGGSNNASVPTASDDAFFDGSGSRAQDNCNLNASQTITNVTFGSGYSGSFIFPNTANLTYTINNTFTCTTNSVFINNSTDPTNFRGLIFNATSNTIATGGKTIPFFIRIIPGSTLMVSGSDLTLEHPIMSGSTSLGGLTFLNTAPATGNNIISRFSTEKVITVGMSVGSNTGGIPSSSAEIYVTGGRIVLPTAVRGIFTAGLFISGTYAPVIPQVVHSNTITYITGSVISPSQLIIGNPTSVNTPGITWDTASASNVAGVTLNITSSFTASLIQPTSFANNNSLTFAGSGGFICRNFIYVSTNTTAGNRTLTFQAGNTYIVTGSLIIGAIAGAVFPNIVTSGSGGAGIARPKLILQQGATCQTAANFTQIDASGGRTINTFSGSLTNTTNIRSFTDYPTTAFSRIT